VHYSFVQGLVIVTGNSGVTCDNPYPTPWKPLPQKRVGVSAGQGRGLGRVEGYLRVMGYGTSNDKTVRSHRSAIK
jgi:hypothetical protein